MYFSMNFSAIGSFIHSRALVKPWKGARPVSSSCVTIGSLLADVVKFVWNELSEVFEAIYRIFFRAKYEGIPKL